MSKNFRVSFDKGINVVGDKSLLPEGFCTILDNVDLRSGSPRPFKAPEYQFSVTSTTTRSWEYRGRWFHSDNWQDHVGQYIGSIERVYTTEEGKYPTKTVNGTTVKLGSLVPQTPVAVVKTTALTPNGITVTAAYDKAGSLVDGSRTYVVCARTADGIMPPSGGITVAVDKAGLSVSTTDPVTGAVTTTTTAVGAYVTITWGGIADATGYIIFEGDSNEQYKLVEVGPNIFSFTDDGSLTPSGDSASQYKQSQSFQYAYSYLRNVAGVQDESGLSPLSVPIASDNGRLLTRDYNNDGYFNMQDAQSFYLSQTGSATASASLTAYPTVSLASAPIYWNQLIQKSIVYRPGQPFANGEKAIFSGMTDPNWSGKTLEISYIDQDHFAIAGVNVPSDGVTPAAGSTPATAIRASQLYKIYSGGSTDFTSFGAATSTAGCYFTASRAGTAGDGTGTVTLQNAVLFPTAAIAQPVKTLITNTGTVAMGNLNIGLKYVIAATGNTDFTLIGASNSSPGTVFTTTGNGTGTGSAIPCVMNGGLTVQQFTDTAMTTGMSYTIVTLGTTNWGTLGAGGYASASDYKIGMTFTHNSATATAGGGIVNLVQNSHDAVYVSGSGITAGLYPATYISPTKFTIPAVYTGSAPLTIQWMQDNNYYYRWNIYRNEQGIWNLVDSVELDKATYTDGKPFAALGGTPASLYDENGQTVSYAPPPLGLTCIESHYGMLFAIQDHAVRWTPILAPDAWPESFSVTCAYKPVALASYAQGLIILCEDAVYRLDGNTATGMSLSKTYTEDGCFAPHSVQKTDKGLIYLSKRGIMIFDGAKAECLTDTRVKGDTLTNPSRIPTTYPFWWMPTIMTKNYADLAGEDSILGSQYAFTMDNTKVIDGYNKHIRSFYHLGKYYLFYTGDNYAGNTAVVVDFQLPGMPVTTLGMKALDAHVDEFHNAYVLFDNAPPVTTVIITSPT